MLIEKISKSVLAIQSLAACAGELEKARYLVKMTAQNGRVVFTLGNGGSAAESNHFVAELVGRFKTSRRPYPAVSLASDAATITAIANDFGYDEVFSRQIRAYAVAGDTVVAFSTSGNSSNVVSAIQQALAMGCNVIAFLGGDGGACEQLSPTVSVVVKSNDTAAIQEAHLAAIHYICEGLEP
jgi:D-sedoheptulose 7-phosphate isomerase